MAKLFKLQMLVLIPVFSCCLPSCSNDDDELNNQYASSVAPKTIESIKSTFPGLRLDSIDAYRSWHNIKITYDKNGLLTNYKEGGVNFNVSWSHDTIFLQCGANKYKAIIGDNGCVSELICPNGKVNSYLYDEKKNLIKYHINIADIGNDAYHELTWSGDNVTNCREWNKHEGTSEFHYVDYMYTYTDLPNIAGILPFESYSWISDCGLSYGSGVNKVLYYAGVLGNKTRNLPKTANNRWYNGQHNQSYNFEYDINSENYVISAHIYLGNHVNNYFYK